jgi:hypothetical protein
VPGLVYTALARPAQDVGQLPPQGDLEVFLPYSLLDRAMYELVQIGLLRKIPVPRSTAGGLSVGFDMDITPTEVPRVRPSPDTPGVLVVDFGARLADTDVGSVRTGAPGLGGSPSASRSALGQPAPPASVPVRLTDGHGRASIAFRPRGTSSGRLYLQYVGVTLGELTGSLTAAGATTSLSRLKTPLQTALGAYLARTLPTVTLIQQAVQVVPGVSIQAGEPRVGARYVGVPLTLHGQ